MKRMIPGLTCIFFFLTLHSNLYGQLLIEDFDYESGTSLTANGWTAHDASGTNPITVSSGSLTYSMYPSSGIGNAAFLNGTGEDVSKTFTTQNSNSIFVSFLVRFTNLSTAAEGHYFLHLNSTIPHFARVYAKKDGSNNVAIGITKSNEDPTYTGYVYSLNTTYLVVVRYSFVTGSSNDQVSLFVFSSGVPSTEPPSPTIGPLAPTTSDPSGLGTIALRQGSVASMTLFVDGIRIATTWSESALPVQLSSFKAHSSGLSAHLRWSTESEINNYGFEIERRTIQEAGGSSTWGQEHDQQRNWLRIGFVPGWGTTFSSKEYSFTDKLTLPGRYAYRLKQLDLDGTYEYHHAAEVEVGFMPKRLELFPNTPNPFNPSTTLGFTLPENGEAVLKVFDMLGREVRTLFEGEAVAGRLYQAVFESASLTSGLYLARLESGGRTVVRKMLLLR